MGDMAESPLTDLPLPETGQQLRNYMCGILPNLEETVLKNLMLKLEKLGVECIADVSFIEESDLDDILTPIAIRRLMRNIRHTTHSPVLCAPGFVSPINTTQETTQLPGTSFCRSTPSPVQSRFQPPASAASSSDVSTSRSTYVRLTDICRALSPGSIAPPPNSASSSTCSTISPPPSPILIEVGNRDPTWASKFQIQWDRLPGDILGCLRNNQRLTGGIKLRFVRGIVDQVRQINHRPTKRHLGIVAQRIVDMYPESLQDKIENVIVGTGYDSLMMQFVKKTTNYGISLKNIKTVLSGPTILASTSYSLIVDGTVVTVWISGFGLALTVLFVSSC